MGSSGVQNHDHKEAGVREPGKIMSLGLDDKGASLSACNNGTKSLLAMVSLEYMGKINCSPIRVLMRGKG